MVSALCCAPAKSWAAGAAAGKLEIVIFFLAFAAAASSITNKSLVVGVPFAVSAAISPALVLNTSPSESFKLRLVMVSALCFAPAKSCANGVLSSDKRVSFPAAACSAPVPKVRIEGVAAVPSLFAVATCASDIPKGFTLKVVPLKSSVPPTPSSTVISSCKNFSKGGNGLVNTAVKIPRKHCIFAASQL